MNVDGISLAATIGNCLYDLLINEQLNLYLILYCDITFSLSNGVNISVHTHAVYKFEIYLFSMRFMKKLFNPKTVEFVSILN